MFILFQDLLFYDFDNLVDDFYDKSGYVYLVGFVGHKPTYSIMIVSSNFILIPKRILFD